MGEREGVGRRKRESRDVIGAMAMERREYKVVAAENRKFTMARRSREKVH